ncbi:MAG: ABC transporter permease subunit [Acidobacteria bacterium]|nr:ABC transporter permease subunit [Acidobacteriota bacterium]
MNQILVIAHNTFRESVRDKVLYNLIFFVFLLLGGSLYFGELTIHNEQKAMIDLGLSVMLLFGFMIAVFIGTGLVYKEIDKRTIYTILSKPIHRYEFIIGKFLGLSITLLVNCTIMLFGIILSLIYINHGFSSGLVSIFPAAFMIYLELLLLTAFALLFSSFSTPAFSVFFSVLVYIIGNFSPDLRAFANILDVNRFPQLKIAQTILHFLYYVVPNLTNFNFIARTAHGEAIQSGLIGYGILYFFIYAGILLSLTILIFERRNFK